MCIHNEQFQEARNLFDNQIDDILWSKQSLYQLRAEFVAYFNRNHIANMQIDEYVIGAIRPAMGFNFCYDLERQLDGLGRILGGTAFKFGVYYGQTRLDRNKEYRFTQAFGNTYQEAFKNRITNGRR